MPQGTGISSSGSLKGSKSLSLALKEQLGSLAIGEPVWKYPPAEANIASARSVGAGRPGAVSRSKASGVTGLTGQDTVPQAPSKKSRAGPVTASGVNQKCSKDAQLPHISASAEPTPKNPQRSWMRLGFQQGTKNALFVLVSYRSAPIL